MIAKSAMTQLLAAFLLMKADGCNAEVRIVNDPGGRIGNYVARYERLRATGDAIAIDGYCASACTLVLGIVPRDKICVTSRAELLFHAAYNPAPHGRRQTNREATDRLYSLYSIEIQRWINPARNAVERSLACGNVSTVLRARKAGSDHCSSATSNSPIRWALT